MGRDYWFFFESVCTMMLRLLCLASVVGLAVSLSRCYKTTSNDILLQGTYLLACVAKEGPLGSRSSVPSGWPYSLVRKQRCGLIVDQDGWSKGAARKAGDFTLPGTEEEGWTIQYTWSGAKKTYSNNLKGRLTQCRTSASIASECVTGMAKARYLCTTTEGLKVDTLVTLPEEAKYVQFDVVVTNTHSSITATDVKYLRNVDPDQDADIASGRTHTTINAIVSTFAAGDKHALVSAMGPKTKIFVGLITTDDRSIPSTGGFSERDPSKILASSTYYKNKGQTRSADQAISMVVNLGNIAPGKTATTTVDYIMTDDLKKTVDDASHIKSCSTAPADPTHGSYDRTKCKDIDAPGNCTLTCDGGFEPTGVAVCEDSDKWASPLPTCVAKACKLPTPTIGNMTTDCKAGSSTSVPHKTICTSTCTSGLTKSGDVECLYGEWTTPECHEPHVYLPDAIAIWEYDNKSDITGNFPDFTLNAGATLSSGFMLLDGTKGTTAGAVVPNPDYTMKAKSMISWVRIDDLTQKAGFMGIQSGSKFDGMSYNELFAKNTFHPTSNSNLRSPNTRLGATTESSTSEFEAVATSWYADNSIRLFRNGEPMGSAYTKGSLQTYPKGGSTVTLGRSANGRTAFKGAVDLSCLFDEGLTPEQQALAYSSRCRATARDCITPPVAPDGGEFEDCKDVEHGGKCKLYCESGYTKSGDAVCESGIWKYPAAPMCAPKGCTALPGAVASAEAWPATCKTTDHMGTCKLTCKTGFVGTGDAVCKSGKWSLPSCVDVCKSMVCPEHWSDCWEYTCEASSASCVETKASNNTDCGFEGKCRGGTCVAPMVNCTCNARVADGFECGAAICKTKTGTTLASFMTDKGFSPDEEFGEGAYVEHEDEKKLWTLDGKWTCTW